MRRTLRFWNHIIASNNAQSFACVLLFPTGTQYPAGSPKKHNCCAVKLPSAVILLTQWYLPFGQVADKFMSLRSTALRCCGNLPEGNHIIKPTQDTFVLAWRKRRTQAKEWALLPAIMRFQKRSVRRAAVILLSQWYCLRQWYCVAVIFALRASMDNYLSLRSIKRRI